MTPFEDTQAGVELPRGKERLTKYLDRVRNVFHKKQKVVVSEQQDSALIVQDTKSRRGIKGFRSRLRRSLGRSGKCSKTTHLDNRSASLEGEQEVAFDAWDSANEPPHIEAAGASSHNASTGAEVVATPEENARSGNVDTASDSAEVVASPEDNVPSGSGRQGQPIASTEEKTHHVTKRRSAPALIQGRTSPARSALSDVTLLDSSRQASPLTSETPIRPADADDDAFIYKSSSPQQDLSSSVWGSLCKAEKEKTRYQELVGQLQAELATERENAQHDRGRARQALDEAQDDIADLEAEVSELKDQLEYDLVEQLQVDLATERESNQHDRGVARQELGEAHDDIADLEAEVSELKDLLEIVRENAQDHLDAYHRCNRDSAVIIEDCNERISDLEAKLNHEQRKARHNFSRAEEYMLLANSWQDAFYQLSHNPMALWKMFIQELRVRGIVVGYSGHTHPVGLRRAVDVEEWVPGLEDRSLLIQEVNDEDGRKNATDGIPIAGDIVVRQHFGRNALGEAEMDHRSVEAMPHNQRHGISQGSGIPDLVVIEREDPSLLEVEDEADTKIVGLSNDLPDVPDIDESRDVVSSEDENRSIDADRLETIPPMQSLKHCKVRAVSRSSEAKTAPWGMPSPLQNARTPSIGSRLVPPTMGNGLLKPLLWIYNRE